MDILICYIIIYIVEAWILWHYCSRMFSFKHSKRTACLSLILLYIALFFICQYKSILLNLAAFLIINCIYIFMAYQTKWHTALFHSAIIAGAMGISETLMAGHIANLFYNIDMGNSYLVQLILLTFFSKSLYFFTLQIIVHFNNSKEKFTVNTQISYPFITIPIITIWISSILLSFCLKTNTDPSNSRIISFCALLIFVINFFIYSIYKYTQQKENESEEFQRQLQTEYHKADYYKLLIQEYESRNILIHDIKNHLQSIYLLNENGDQDKVADYINNMIRSSSLKTTVRVSDNDVLNAILCRYIKKAEENGIALRTDIRSGSFYLMSDTDMTALFCNLLDNALESAGLVPDSFIELNIKDKADTPFAVLTMINSCKADPFDEAGRLITAKANKLRHGYGMKSIARIAAKYGGDMTAYYNEKTNTFHTIVMMKKDKETA